MKTFTLQKLIISFFTLALILSSPFNLLSQEIESRDGSEFIKVDINQYTSFNNSIIVSKLHQLQDAKVVLGDEKGTIYIYPKSNFSETLRQVKSIIDYAEELNQSYDKPRKAQIIDSLDNVYGEWLSRYAEDGIRENENDSCHKAFPFCTGSIYSFPAGTGPGAGSPAQNGPFYDCLTTRPNPAWYYLKIENPGPIGIHMYSTPSEDIDFCLWGPFIDPIAPCPMTATQGGLTAQKVEDCSYSMAATETANISNGQTGEYYILVITNFSNHNCNITFQQTSGTGTTDCTILPPPATSNSPLCIGESIELSASNVNDASYHWTGPAGFVSNEQYPVIPNITMANAGEYILTITINGVVSDPTSTIVEIFEPPVGTLSGGGTICQGDSVMMTLTCDGPPVYRALLSSGPGFPWVIYFDTTTYNFWTSPTDTLTYHLIGIRNAACDGAFSGEAVINVNPRPQTAYTSSNPCADLGTQFTDGTTINGGLLSEWHWNFGDLNSSTEQNPIHTYANPANYNVTLNVVANNGCETSITQPLEIKPTPSVDAGSNVSIPFGTNTTLSGTASGGSGFHTYQWQPFDKVVSPTTLITNTVLLGVTTDYTLTASDANGCQNSDGLTVTITGGPLTSQVTATDDEICNGTATTLRAIPSGGSGIYTYTWTSTPAGFNSDLQEVTVVPTVTTAYHVAVFDNFTTVNLDKTVTVNNNPVVTASNDVTIPHGTNTNLTSTVTGGSPMYNYLWGPPGYVTTPYAASTQTTNLYGSQIFNVKVTDTEGCIGTDVVSVTVSGGALSLNPTAEDSVICRNESTIIRALPGGGSGQYVSYNWTSKPAGFTSTIAEPTVSPTVTTVYKVTVNDGYNTVTDSLKVRVDQLPVIDIIPDDPHILVISPTEIGICVFDSIALNAGNPGAEFLWSNGSTDQSIVIATSGITYDEQSYNVIVTNPLTGCVNTAQVKAYFTFANCSYGIEEKMAENRLKIYPNPSITGQFNITIEELSGHTRAEIFNSYGKLIYSKEYILQKNVTFRDDINISNNPGGVYFLRLSNSETVLMRQLIKGN
jgi:PKD repeat protein